MNSSQRRLGAELDALLPAILRFRHLTPTLSPFEAERERPPRPRVRRSTRPEDLIGKWM
jgi:hypothetical protein